MVMVQGFHGKVGRGASREVDRGSLGEVGAGLQPAQAAEWRPHSTECNSAATFAEHAATFAEQAASFAEHAAGFAEHAAGFGGGVPDSHGLRRWAFMTPPEVGAGLQPAQAAEWRPHSAECNSAATFAEHVATFAEHVALFPVVVAVHRVFFAGSASGSSGQACFGYRRRSSFFTIE